MSQDVDRPAAAFLMSAALGLAAAAEVVNPWR